MEIAGKQAKTQSTQKALTLGLAVAVFFALSIAFLQTAWVSDDAFITFRVIENTISGHGPNWNPGERIQAYTHPLWFAILLPFIAVFDSPYYVSIFISYLLLVFSFFLIIRSIEASRWHALIALATLIFSRSFIDYSSSGLENPLTHMLLAAFSLAWMRKDQLKNPTLLLVGIASALFLTRPDSLVLLTPAILWHLWRRRHSLHNELLQALVGATPALIWVVFSLFYYGSAVPNTAIAKVQTGLSPVDNIGQALNYIAWSVRNDKATIALLGFGVVLGLTDKKRSLAPLGVGILSWILYLFYVGSDYMGGRFLSAPLIFSVVIIGNRIQDNPRIILSVLSLIFLTSSGSLKQTIFSPSTYSNPVLEASGISDERGFYYPALGLLPALHHGTWRRHPWMLEGDALRLRNGWYTRCAIGMIGYAGGEGVKWIDPLALTDGFLARLPARDGARVGHYERAFPNGYLETIASGTNRIEDPTLRTLYEDVHLATQAPLLSSRRLGAIWRLNTDRYRANRAGSYDRNDIGLPGFQVETRDKFSCYGIPYGGDGVWAIDAPPLLVRRVNFD